MKLITAIIRPDDLPVVMNGKRADPPHPHSLRVTAKQLGPKRIDA